MTTIDETTTTGAEPDLTTREAYERLGCSRAWFVKLVKHRGIEPTSQCRACGGEFWSCADVDGLLPQPKDDEPA